MALVDLIMPKLGESIMEATILKWHKQPGDTVSLDETVLEIATDKVDSEVPSTTAGTIEEILWKVNDVVPIGSVIARIRTGVAEAIIASAPDPTPVQQAVVVESKPTPVPATRPTAPQTISANRFYSPLVLNIAASEGVSLSELETVPGSGNEGRVTKKDILQYVAQRQHRPAAASTSVSYTHLTLPTKA